MPPEIIFACSDLRHLTGGLRFAGIAERFCKVCRHIGPQGKAGAPTQAAGTMQPAEPHPVARRTPSPGLRAPDFALRAPGFGPWTPGLGLKAPRSRQTCVAEWTLARNLCCRTDAKPLLEAPCRPFCNTSVFKASEMQQKFSPGRAGCPAGPGRPRCALLPSEARCVQADTCGGARGGVSQQNAAGAKNNMQVFTFFGLKRK